MNDYQHYIGCATCAYRSGNICAQYKKPLKCGYDGYEQPDECLDGDGKND